MTRLYEPERDTEHRAWEAQAGFGGGTLPLFLSADAACWLATASFEHGSYTLMRLTADAPRIERPKLASTRDFPWTTEQIKAVTHELHRTGMIGEAGYNGYYLTYAGEVVLGKLPQPAYRPLTNGSGA